MIDQLSFDGRIVKGVYLNLPGIGKVEYPSDAEVHTGDEIEVSYRIKVSGIGHGSDYDKTGIEKGEFARVYSAKPIVPTLSFGQHLTRDEIEQAWRQRQGAAG